MNLAHENLVRAVELQDQGARGEAARLFREILGGDPTNVAALYSLGLILLEDGEHEEALNLAEQGIRVARLIAPMRFLHGAALQAAGHKEKALRSYEVALEIMPDYVEALINSGVLLRDMLRHHESLERFSQVLATNPNHQAALANCVIILTEFKQSEHAIAPFERLLKINPDYEDGLCLPAYERLHLCDRADFEMLPRQIVEGVRAGRRTCKTLALMAVTDSASHQLVAARTFAQHFFPRSRQSFSNGERYRHDKWRFETIAVSFGIGDQRRRRALEVDIVVDLAGYASDSRTGVFAHHPAPAQLSNLTRPVPRSVTVYGIVLNEFQNSKEG